MPTVWAHFSGHVPGFRDLGIISEQPKAGWSHVVNFTTYSNLVAWLMSGRFYDRVSRLNVNCHGNDGELVLDSRVTHANCERLSGLGVYLRRNAKLIFTGCLAGREAPGSRLLKRLSHVLWNRKIIAFELVSVLGSQDQLEFGAGDVHYGEATSGTQLARSGSLDPNPRVTPWNVHSKWAYRGRIIRYPAFEQARRPKRKCANPECPGHRSERNQCSGWHPGCEW